MMLCSSIGGYRYRRCELGKNIIGILSNHLVLVQPLSNLIANLMIFPNEHSTLVFCRICVSCGDAGTSITVFYIVINYDNLFNKYKSVLDVVGDRHGNPRPETEALLFRPALIGLLYVKLTMLGKTYL